MVRKFLIVFLLSFFALPLYVNAQEDSASPGARFERIQEAVGDRIEELQNRKAEIQEEMKVKREEFKERLQTIRDEVKRRIVERIDARMDSVNQRATNRFLTILDKLQAILNRFVGRTEDAKLAGKDTANLDAAIARAQASIDDAKTAVASQAAKMYVIEIASESALRNDVGEVVSQLKTDLKGVHELVVVAKQAVQNVAMEFAKLRGNALTEENAATDSLQ